MLPLYKRLLNRLPKGFWAGLGFGVLAFLICAIVLGISYFYILRPLVWPTIYGEPYVNTPGPFPPHSGEWLFVQLIWFLSGIVLGLTVSFVSGHRRSLVLLSLAVMYSTLSVAAEATPGLHGWRFVLSYVQVPLGCSLGFFIWRTKQAGL
jgi:hypothetical protein